MTSRKPGKPSRTAADLEDDLVDVGRALGVLPGQSRAQRRASHRAWLFLALAVMACILLVGAILAVRSDSSRTQPQAEPRADVAGDAVAASVVEQCAATDLVDVGVRMQPEERGTAGTRTLGTMTLSTGSSEALRVWVLVDEGEEGEQSWSREGWQPVGPALSRGTPIEQRLSRTVYDDGGSTWRTITGVAAWHTSAECAELPTPAQLDEIAAPV